MKKILIFFALVIYTAQLKAQSYAFSVSQQPYNELLNPFSVTNGATWDDPNLTIPISFNFSLYNTQLSNVYINSYGLGGMLAATDLSSGITPLFFPYGPDIIDRGYDFNTGTEPTGGLSNISYQESGIPGNKILKIEWKNVGFYSELADDDISTDFISFQVWFYENNGDIEVHYGPSSISQPTLCYDGENGPFIGIYSAFDFSSGTTIGSALELTGTAATPTAQASFDPYSAFVTGNIPNGRVYKFTKTLANLDESLTSIPFSVSPNPTSGLIQLASKNSIERENQIIITNQLGQIIQVIENATFANKEISIDLSEYEKGIYFITLSSSGQKSTNRIVKN